MNVIDRISKIAVEGEIPMGDLYYFFSTHEVLTDPSADGACACGEDDPDWPRHIREEFIVWIKNL